MEYNNKYILEGMDKGENFVEGFPSYRDDKIKDDNNKNIT